MKKSFRQYKSMIWTQLYLTLVPLGLAVFAVIKGKPKNLDAWGIPILSFLLAATFFLCYSFYTFRTLVFTDDAVEVRLGRLTLQSIPLTEVQFVVVFLQEWPRSVGRNVVFARRRYTVNELHKASYHRKTGNHEIIFCEWDAALVETAKSVFPNLFDPRNEYIHHRR